MCFRVKYFWRLRFGIENEVRKSVITLVVFNNHMKIGYLELCSWFFCLFLIELVPLKTTTAITGEKMPLLKNDFQNVKNEVFAIFFSIQCQNRSYLRVRLKNKIWKAFFVKLGINLQAKKWECLAQEIPSRGNFLERSGGSHVIKLSNAFIRNGISKMYPKVKIRQPKPLIGPSKQSFYIH